MQLSIAASTGGFSILNLQLYTPHLWNPPGRSQVDTPLEVPARERFQRQGPWVNCPWGWSSIHTWEYPTTVHIYIYIYIYTYVYIYIHMYIYIPH